ncbi:MAG: UDP-N-acetylmuramoyl-L-alanine--D-glutamate ligase [Litorilinea sp.]
MVSSNSIQTEQEFAGKHIVILGLARQGKALARYFARAGAFVTISDLASADQLAAECQSLDGLSIRYVLGSHPESLLDGCDLLCLSGGVPPQLPIVQAAIRRGIPLSNDSLLTVQRAHALGLGPVLAITGSSGKTTTTTLVGKMLEAAGYVTHVGGNIGAPLLDRLRDIYTQEPIVLELSSFQLELFDRALAYGDFSDFGPQIATLLNITPNHLDRHPDMAAYTAAKLNLIRHMPTGASLILSADDAVTARLIPQAQARALPDLPAAWRLDALLAETRAWIEARKLRVIPFSRTERLESGAWIDDDTLMLGRAEICRRRDVQLRGEHNISNLLAALATSAALTENTVTDAGFTLEPARLGEVATTFTGVAHRLEIVADEGSVVWINDSIATSPERAMAGLRAVADSDQTVILLAGGKDKNLPWDDFASEIVNHVDFLIGFGHFGPMIVELVQDRARYHQEKAPNCAVVQRLEEAVGLAGRIAQTKTIVLLSPGGTSYDMYRDFEARGEHFRNLVRAHITTTHHTGSPAAVGISP